MSATSLVLLGRGVVLPASPRPARISPELAVPELELPVRTAGGELGSSPAGMTRWPRLDRYGRALAVAVGRALDGAGPRHEPSGGLYVSSQHSCFDTNAAFHRGLVEKGPRLASPLVFPYTLPGAAAAEVAMHFRLGGEHVVFAGGPAAALASVLAATDALEVTGSPLVVAAADVLGPELLRAWPEPLAPGVPPAEGAAALWLAHARTGGRGLGLAVEGAVGPAGAGPGAWVETARAALRRADLPQGELVRVFSASAAESARRAELDGIGALRPSLPVVQLCFTLGDAGATLGLFAVLAALEERGPTLVVATDRGGTAALVIVPEAV